MPRVDPEHGPLQDTFDEQLKGLNGALGEGEREAFKWTTACKQHEDLFGDVIKRDEKYLQRRPPDMSWDQDIKLSVRSMDLLLLAIDSPGSPMDAFLREMRDRPARILQQYRNV